MIEEFFFEDIYEYKLFIKREDLIHPIISGNKFWKLKYNIKYAEKLGYKKLLTFGGAYSNHILATAYAGLHNKFDTIGVIRGEEVINNWEDNPTLLKANKFGMKLYFLDRENYRKKNMESLNIEENYYLIPEGGSNELAIKGIEEMMSGIGYFDYIFVSVGTGGTISGILNYLKKNNLKTFVYGVCALKNAEYLLNDINKWTQNNNNYKIIFDNYFGGYAKTNDELINFINKFYITNNILLDPIYNGKMIYYLKKILKKNIIDKNSKILCIHTGGLQGIEGFNIKNKKQIIGHEI